MKYHNELKKLKIFIVTNHPTDDSYANWISPNIVERMEDADIVLFTGGEDVDPSLYGEPAHKYTHFNSVRDKYEKEFYDKAKENNKFMLGVCRGFQFLAVMNGCKLKQHIQGHHQPHTIHPASHRFSFSPFFLPSDHHQSVLYEDMCAKGVAIGRKAEITEIGYFPTTKCFGVQAHPEWEQDTANLEQIQNLLYSAYNGEYDQIPATIPSEREYAKKFLNYLLTNIQSMPKELVQDIVDTYQLELNEIQGQIKQVIVKLFNVPLMSFSSETSTVTHPQYDVLLSHMANYKAEEGPFSWETVKFPTLDGVDTENTISSTISSLAGILTHFGNQANATNPVAEIGFSPTNLDFLEEWITEDEPNSQEQA